MVAETWQEKILIFLITYVVSALTMPISGIIKPFVVFFLYLQHTLKPSYTPECHAEKVKYVQKQVVDWNKSGRKTKMCSARPGWRTFSIRTPIYKDTLTGIHVDLGDIVKIDPIRRVLTVEPLMTMGRLTSILIPMGWTIPVLPELNDLTVGGLLCGAGIETSSHKYGLFQNICISMEVVLASGEVVICSKDQYPDLFHAMPLSCGTLGFLTSAELRIIPAEKYVKLDYIPVRSLDEAISTFERQTYRKFGNEFVEGIMYSLDKGVIMVGNMSTKAEPGKVNSIGRWYKTWFFKHVETFLNKNPGQNFVEYIPLRDYYHRHTQSLFWETMYFIPYGNNVIFRYIFGWILPLRLFLIKLVVPEAVKNFCDRNHVAQDFLVPMEKLKESLILTHEEMQVYPIWLCPTKLINEPGASRFLGTEDEMYVDFGVYGVTKLVEYEVVKTARKMELFCIKNRGYEYEAQSILYQALYSDVCMTREEFEQMFDLELYKKVREDLNCTDAFPDIYEKVCRAARR